MISFIIFFNLSLGFAKYEKGKFSVPWELRCGLYLELVRSFSKLYTYGNNITNSIYIVTSIDFHPTFDILSMSYYFAWFSRFIVCIIFLKIGEFSPRRIWVWLKVITRGCAVYGNLLFRTMLSEWHQITRLFHNH